MITLRNLEPPVGAPAPSRPSVSGAPASPLAAAASVAAAVAADDPGRSATRLALSGTGEVGPEAPPPRADIFHVGELVAGVYEIVGVLGAGGMGQVFEARDRQLGRQVALKAGWPDVGNEPLLREARALAAFRHAGLVTVHTIGRHRGVDFLVMELLTGVTLSAWLAQRRQEAALLSLPEALDVLASVCDTLGVLHAAGLAHRDLKPDNLMLTPRGRVVLLDLGIVRLERFIREEREVSGSPRYLAPETIRAEVRTGEAHLVDIYALGVMAFELITGRHPMSADERDPLAMMASQLRETPARLSAARAGVPQPLERLVDEMLAKRPEDRPHSIEVVAAMLRSIRGCLERQPVAPLSVLVVDDDDDARRLVEYLVRRAAPDAEVRAAADGKEALRLFHERPPELLLLDLDLPQMTGMEVCMYLRGTHLADRTTICVISSFADDNQVLLERLGVADVIAKKSRGPAALAAEIKGLVRRIEEGRGRFETPSPVVAP